MIEKFNFIFKDFKKAYKYSKILNKNIQNPFTSKNVHNFISNMTYIWVENKPEADL